VTAGAAADYRPPCPCCGGRMIIVESFGPAGAPRAPPSPQAGAATAMHDAHHRLSTTAAHRGTSPPALRRCRPVVPEATSYTFDQAKIAPSTTAAIDDDGTAILSIRRQLRGQRVPYPNRCP
jgi:hypothetical protein